MEALEFIDHAERRAPAHVRGSNHRVQSESERHLGKYHRLNRIASVRQSEQAEAVGKRPYPARVG